VQDSGLSHLGKEGYRLVVTPESIRISAADQAGMFYGVQTLRQLLPVKQSKDMAWTVPSVTIEDQPRFAWRGLMLDSGHDFQRKEFVLRFIDLMALHKFNVFHWHLTDLGTWSMEIKGWPKLLDPSTRRNGVKPGHYTQEEIREVIRYAAERHITILPEIDMPGHATPALLAYPEFDCPLPLSARRCDNAGCCSPLYPELDCKRPVSAVPNPIRGRPWSFCLGNEKTYAFLEDVLKQVTELFPSNLIHIGGDECRRAGG
jgi:hexosaminidase